ncbi:CBS domain-containing protein [Methanococcoides vulcani]|uniref:CBS domain-containing protein n=1 Tax=Methanococcoides vulcani TaxID=1353158 RepID=A0A1H9Y8J8_9EURY|nr:CBS domain-containing protein [Methanococcoides vulcani]SES64755.1 CBS domain-containing protein [Methanococcoides vulcani]
MKVKDIMSSSVIVCSPEDSISSVAQLLKKEDISGVPVVSASNVMGIVSEGDLLKLLEIPEHGGLWLPSPFEVIEIPIRELISWEDTKKMLSDVGSKPVSDIMEKDIFTVSLESSVEDASRLMTKHKVNRLPVLDGDKLVGIITRGDIIRGLAGI